jgi:hypothetical protein
MVKKTLKNKKYGRRLGAGFFNFFRRKKTEPNTTVRRLPAYPPRGYSIPFKSKIDSLEPFSYDVNNERREFFPEYEPYRDASERMFAYIYQKYKRQPYNPEEIKLTVEQRTELKKAIYKQLKDVGALNGKLDDDKLKQIMKKLFGLETEEDIKEFNAEYVRVESTTPQYGPSAGLKPLRPYSYLARLIPALLKSDRELQYTSNQEMYMCVQSDLAKNTYRTLNSDDCVFITRSIPHLYRHLIGNPNIANVFYMVLNPLYFPVGPERTSGKTFNTSINSRFNEPVSIKMKTLGKISFIDDAFENNGLQLVHPRLGLLLQEQLPNLWNKSCYNTRNSKSVSGRSLDFVDRVVILTLQKYAAIRRYMWSKDPNVTALIYQVNPISISNELRNISQVLPSTVVTNKNRQSESFSYLRDIPTYMEFDERDFLKEFIENQQWASNSSKVRYRSLLDPALDNILPKNCNSWTIPAKAGPVSFTSPTAPFKASEETAIPALSEIKNNNNNVSGGKHRHKKTRKHLRK